MRIVCLGNEFIEGDSLAKKVGEELVKEGFDVLNIKDSFELMGILASQGEAVSDGRKADDEIIILDVVEGLDEVREIGVEDLRVDSIVSAHDFDAGFVLRLLGERVGIIGMPRDGDAGGVLEKVLKIITN